MDVPAHLVSLLPGWVYYKVRAVRDKTFGSEAYTMGVTPSFTSGFKGYWGVWVMVGRLLLNFNRFCSNYFSHISVRYSVKYLTRICIEYNGENKDRFRAEPTCL